MLLLANFASAKPILKISRHAENPLLAIEPIFPGDLKTVTIPIKRARNLIVVEAQVDSVAGNFILDTGAPYLVLNTTYFRNMPKIGDIDANGVNGSSNGTFRTEVKDFFLGLDLQYKRIKADVCDLSSIENSKKLKVLGIMGTQLFRKMAITIDLFHSVIYLHKLDSKGEIPEAQRTFRNPDMRTSFKYINDVIFMKGMIAEKPLWFVFDTGAESNLLANDVPKAVLKTMHTINRSTIVGVGGPGNETAYANFDKLIIGNYQFTNNRILLTNLTHLSRAYGYSMDAILGYDFFGRGVFTINFVKKEFEMYIYNH
ncbi:pepsin/retropepsin-like aspartic protease family protein [Mucilaginibacter lacusdianchii]|uniref:pepsin/retropepsin-like aspartic protease family protein n=1 Tax=Mucilaginibacter lacusdianchii TaxID=2684211 RepID=UPI00131EAA6C|nr:pepsin/retropepsin-like aspartic protease family protein [Mucilaginibacter sp. JXJ CY 39]